MSTWSSEIAALATEIQRDEGISYAQALRIAQAEFDGLERYADEWNLAVKQEAESLTAYVVEWDRTAAMVAP